MATGDTRYNILELEAEALLLSYRHLLRSSACFGCRLLAFVDNLPLCLAASKSRAASPLLMAHLLKVAMLSLASGSRLRGCRGRQVRGERLDVWGHGEFGVVGPLCGFHQRGIGFEHFLGHRFDGVEDRPGDESEDQAEHDAAAAPDAAPAPAAPPAPESGGPRRPPRAPA